MNTENFKHTELTELIIKAFYSVYNAPGYGFLEKVYENAMLNELRSLGLQSANQIPIEVYYQGQKVCLYFADIMVNQCVIIEVKAAEGLAEEHELQLINYLKATDIEVGLLLNFGKKPELKRKVFSAPFKNHNKS
jgi:GxxExxY protein